MSQSGHIKRLRRAWVLVTAPEAERAAQEIFKLNDTLPWPHSQVVRADVVDAVDGAEGVTIVVPIWAADLDGLHAIRDQIQSLPGVQRTQFVAVRMGRDRPLHHPFPPQKAQGYVTVEEENSPIGPMGANAWG